MEAPVPGLPPQKKIGGAAAGRRAGILHPWLTFSDLGCGPSNTCFDPDNLISFKASNFKAF